jgi:hypothetical protein
VSLGSLVNLLEVLGVNVKSLKQMRGWVAEGRSVTLRFKAEERCSFNRETKREQESDTKFVREYSGAFGGGKTTDKVVTTITEWFWDFDWDYELFAFVGNDPEDKVVLQGRRAKYEKMTTTKDSPYPQVRVRDPIDVNLTLLLHQLDPECSVIRFAIDRAHKECRTPRRNPDVEKMLSLMSEVEEFGASLQRYLVTEMFSVQTPNKLDFSTLNDKSVFVAAVPLFAKKQTVSEDHHGQGLVALTNASKVGSFLLLVAFCLFFNFSKKYAQSDVVPSRSNLSLLLNEQKRTLAEKLSGLAKVFPDGVNLVTVAEANLVVASLHVQTLSQYLEAGVSYIEELLRKQLVAAIGKSVCANDFAEYMVYHNRRTFREEYQPKPFCYSVARPMHSPEGVISLEASRNDGSIPQPVPTIVNCSALNSPMQFNIDASSKVAFTGQVFVHGLLMHEFEGESGLALSLNARARQFSCFLVLVGRIAGPGLFDPQFGVICQNKDDFTIPLDVETIPSAGEFKAATVSISPEQQAFAKMFRGMQLASTLFAVCVIQIKPQLERLLSLYDDSLTKEIKLTQDLLRTFIQYQIPSDLISYGGNNSDGKIRVEAVRRSVRKVQLLVESEELKEKLVELDAEEAQVLEQIASMRSMVVYVKTLTGKTVVLHPSPVGTVLDLKCLLQNVEGIPPDQQRFVFAGKQLEDFNTLQSYGIGNGATVHLVLRMR